MKKKNKYLLFKKDQNYLLENNASWEVGTVEAMTEIYCNIW